jgi:uncharacterized protein (DUF58 family)
MTVNASRIAHLPADRGGRQHMKIMQLLAAVDADGSAPLLETLVATVGRLKRGMTAVIVTASLDPGWVRALAALRARGVSCVVVTLDPAAFEPPAEGPDAEAAAKRTRALRHALAEYELPYHVVTPDRPLGEVLAG